MKRHLLVGRFGPGDRVRVPKASDEAVTPLELVASERGLRYGIGRALTDLRKLDLYPTEIGLDLLVLAAHVHAADTRISRGTESQDSWTREIRLVVPVSDLNCWNAAAPTIKRALDFLTGDRWTVGFRSRPARFADAVPQRPAMLIEPPFDAVNLFSGGLDSLIGAIDILHQGGQPLFVSHAGEGAVSAAQEACFDRVKRSYPLQRVERLRVWMNFPNKLVRRVASEDTTRGRSFLFFALGAFAGSGLGKDFVLRAPENGLIALNVPLDRLRLGALSTRTTHPFYIARWNEILAAIGIAGRVDNPYWDKTKGEMVAACRNQRLLQELAPTSLSCASPTKGRYQGKGSEHCGYCLPCLIRRAALVGMPDRTTYTIPDLTADAWNTRRKKGEQIRSFQYAIDRLRKQPKLARLLIHKPGPLSDDPSRLTALAGVYRRGLEEVGRILVGVRASPS
jgi:hypothetical protein